MERSISQVPMNDYEKTSGHYLLLDDSSAAIDAVAAAARIRASEMAHGQPMPMIAIGATLSVADERRLQEAGIDAVVQPPLQVEVILSVLKRLQPSVSNPMSPEHPKPTESGIIGTSSMRDALQAEYGPELATELCQLFLTETPDVIDTLRQACEQRDTLTWQQALLRLQSSCHSLGAKSLERLCLGGPQMTESQAQSACEALVEQLEVAFWRLQRQLEEEFAIS